MNERYLSFRVFSYCISLLIPTISLLPADAPHGWVELAKNVGSAVEKVAGGGILTGTVLDNRKGSRLGNGYCGAPADRGTAPTAGSPATGSSRDTSEYRGVESSGRGGYGSDLPMTDAEFYQGRIDNLTHESEKKTLTDIKKDMIVRQESIRRDKARGKPTWAQENELAVVEAEYAKRQPKSTFFSKDMSDVDLDKNIRNLTDELQRVKDVYEEAAKPDFWGRKGNTRCEENEVKTVTSILERYQSEKARRVKSQPKKKVAAKEVVQVGEYKEPKMPTILEESPFKDSDDLPSSGGPLGPLTPGQVIGVAGLTVAAKVAGTAMVAAPAAGGTAVGIGGGAVAGKTACVVVATNPALWIPVAIGATVLGVGGLGYLAYNKLYSAQKVPQLVTPNLGNGGNNNQPSNPGDPKDPKEPKERKFNTVQKTEGLRKLKENYRYDKQSNLYKLKDNGTPIKCTRTGKEVKAVKWDHSHGDVEAINKQGVHMGSLDPVTFEMYKAPVKHRNDPL